MVRAGKKKNPQTNKQLIQTCLEQVCGKKTVKLEVDSPFGFLRLLTELLLGLLLLFTCCCVEAAWHMNAVVKNGPTSIKMHS